MALGLGLVSTGKSKEVLNQKLGSNYPLFTDFEEALALQNPMLSV
jgi:hypothetical protein